MGSKTFLFLGLFLAIFFMISSEVIARELAETSNSVKPDNENEVHVVGHGGYNGVSGDGHHGCHYGCCGKYKYGCKKCCSYAGEAMDKVTEAQPHN
ncbi:glycine-rich protein-like isoform X1 [Lycium ferocissimum]|uniref:glycine-rich protein-like isoform X1 n=1 Tax=Lycium ferocissimum TaxID=112874 RepID=UPI002815DB86|nr:glycine-rich protein-like isoform X1 [Lycium ferocissimum]